MHHRLIDSQRITRSNVWHNASTCYSFNSNQASPPSSVSSVRPISPPLVFPPSSSLPLKPQNSDHSHVFYSMRIFFPSLFFLPLPPSTRVDDASSTRANRIQHHRFHLSLIAYCARDDNRSIIGIAGYGWRGEGRAWKRSREEIRIISDYNLLYREHQRYRTRSRVEEGPENDVSVLASFLNRFKRRCYLPVFFSSAHLRGTFPLPR